MISARHIGIDRSRRQVIKKIALGDGKLAKRLDAWRQRQSESVPESPVDGKS